MPTHLPPTLLTEAELAIKNAQEVRALHRKRTQKGDRQRQHDLELAMKRIKLAMEPLRSEIGRFPYGPQTDIAEENRAKVRETSLALQRERRKLWKMLRKGKPRRRKRKPSK